MTGQMIQLLPADHAELVGRLTALRSVAEDLAEVFDEPRAAQGAREMLASIYRMLELLARP
jgi:hypothetical protein